MSVPEREVIERAIGQALLEQWDPLAVNALPGPHAEYDAFVHGIYSLLARGGSDTQVTRELHRIERDVLGKPDLAARDISGVVTRLRQLERSF